MITTAKFYSNALEKEVSSEILEVRKYTLKLKLEDGKVIIKKIKQLLVLGET